MMALNHRGLEQHIRETQGMPAAESPETTESRRPTGRGSDATEIGTTFAENRGGRATERPDTAQWGRSVEGLKPQETGAIHVEVCGTLPPTGPGATQWRPAVRGPQATDMRGGETGGTHWETRRRESGRGTMAADGVRASSHRDWSNTTWPPTETDRRESGHGTLAGGRTMSSDHRGRSNA